MKISIYIIMDLMGISGLWLTAFSGFIFEVIIGIPFCTICYILGRKWYGMEEKEKIYKSEQPNYNLSSLKGGENNS